MDTNDCPIFKIALIGSHSTGKTTILTSYHTGKFMSETEPTIGANFISHMVNFDDETIELQIWDTAGQDRYKSIGPLYYRDALCCLAVYDATKEDSLLELDDFIGDYIECAVCDSMVFVVCNKCDLITEDRSIVEKGREFAKKLNYPFYETSAKTGQGINEMFEDVVKYLHTKEIEKKNAAKIKQNNSCC